MLVMGDTVVTTRKRPFDLPAALGASEQAAVSAKAPIAAQRTARAVMSQPYGGGIAVATDVQ
jgi:hypothetical protein